MLNLYAIFHLYNVLILKINISIIFPRHTSQRSNAACVTLNYLSPWWTLRTHWWLCSRYTLVTVFKVHTGDCVQGTHWWLLTRYTLVTVFKVHTGYGVQGTHWWLCSRFFDVNYCLAVKSYALSGVFLMYFWRVLALFCSVLEWCQPVLSFLNGVCVACLMMRKSIYIITAKPIIDVSFYDHLQISVATIVFMAFTNHTDQITTMNLPHNVFGMKSSYAFFIRMEFISMAKIEFAENISMAIR